MARTTYQTTLTRILDLTPSVKSFFLKFPDGREMQFAAGQFVVIDVPNGKRTVKRAYSIASPPQIRDGLELVVKEVEGGAATDYLWQAREGVDIEASGPFGRFVINEADKHDFVFVATGTGIAPIRSILLDLYHSGFNREAWLFFGVRHEDEILYEEDFRELADNHGNFHFIPTLSRPRSWSGEVGYVQEKVSKYLPEIQDKVVYCCGRSRMIEGVTDTLMKTGFPKRNIVSERFD